VVKVAVGKLAGSLVDKAKAKIFPGELAIVAC
jgi:hypothetical protein